MDIREYLDATYLKTAEEAGLTDAQNRKLVHDFVLEAIHENYKLVMLRPDVISLARYMVDKAGSGVLVGTVIDFPGGSTSLKFKLYEARQAIEEGADELDFVVNYNAYIQGLAGVVAHEVKKCTAFCFKHNRVVKWIIEVAALTDDQIAGLTALIRDVIVANFNAEDYHKVFIKSSTGFYKTENGKPNGATPAAVKIMLANAGTLPVKAAGGVKNYIEALEMISLGVKRIGTSSARQIVNGTEASGNY